MNEHLSIIVVVAVLTVAAGGLFVMSDSPTGLATAAMTPSQDSLGSCCCEGPQGIFKVPSGRLTSELGYTHCAMVCAQEGSKNTPITTTGAC